MVGDVDRGHGTARRALPPGAERGLGWPPAACERSGLDEDPDSASTAITTLREAGVPTAAWVVLTHSSLLGSAHPDVAVRNCFEETYPWALCPSHPEVRAYAATLAAESVRGLDVDTVVLEACGQLGVVHQCRHEKTDGVWSPALVQLLSVCCCQRCAAGWAAPPETVTRRLRETALRLLAEPDLTATETGLPTDLLGELLASRHSGTDALREEVLDALGTTATGRPTVALHGSLDPWATGALPGLTQAAGKQADTVVLPSWQPGEASLAATREARARLPAETAVGSYVTGVAGQPLADPAGDVRALRRTGSTELHLYHLGLASPARWPDLCSATAAAHDA